MVPCHSMNAGSVVGIPSGSADTQTLPYAKELYFFHSQAAGTQKLWARALVEFPRPIFSLY